MSTNYYLRRRGDGAKTLHIGKKVSAGRGSGCVFHLHVWRPVHEYDEEEHPTWVRGPVSHAEWERLIADPHYFVFENGDDESEVCHRVMLDLLNRWSMTETCGEFS